MIHLLADQSQFDALVAAHAPCIIFKHSTRCSISNHACREVYDTIETLQLDNIYLVDVLTQRDLSNYIAQITDIRHESPQLIFFDETGRAYASASHGQVNERHIRHVLGGGWAGNAST